MGPLVGSSCRHKGVERRKQQHCEVVHGLKPSGFTDSANLRGREGKREGKGK